MAKQEHAHKNARKDDSGQGDDLGIGLICPADSSLYRIYFRESGQQFTAYAMIDDLKRGDLVMVTQEHGLEPAVIVGNAPQCGCKNKDNRVLYEIAKKGGTEEYEKFAALLLFEKRANKYCNNLVIKHSLKMCLVRVERFYNGSKMIFYFTAENRVDFRALVKDLVQEFRTRVEMRQVGVRHETKMVGGIGTCGRELCCSSFIRKFDSVSIKMAKEQDLPLNPTKISGLCNRLLCCLTYEYETYKSIRKKMPKVGKLIAVEGQQYKVRRQNIMQNSILVTNREGDEVVLEKEKWQLAASNKSDSSARRRDTKKPRERSATKEPTKPAKESGKSGKEPVKAKKEEKEVKK